MVPKPAVQPPRSEPGGHVGFISPAQGDQNGDLGAVIYLEDNLRKHRRGTRRGRGQGRKLIKDVIKLVTPAGNFRRAHTQGFAPKERGSWGICAPTPRRLTSETEATNTGEHSTRDARYS